VSNFSWAHGGGPLACFADGYGSELSGLGFTHNSVVTHVVLMGQLSRWMSEVGIVGGDLTEGRVERFFDSRRARGQRRVPTARTLAPLFVYLRSQGAAGGCCRDAVGGSPGLLSASSGRRPWVGTLDGRGPRGESPAVFVGADVGQGRRDRSPRPVCSRCHTVFALRVFPAWGWVGQEQGDRAAVAAAVPISPRLDRERPRRGGAACGGVAGHGAAFHAGGLRGRRAAVEL
jgi:hypothetical protein